MIYLYGITDPREPPQRAGLRDAPLRAIRKYGLAAVVSEHEELVLAPEEDELWAHEAVVEALMEQGPVLPMRIGSVTADEQAVVTLMRDRGAEFRRALEGVRGAVELGVRAVTRGEAEQPPAPVHAGSSGPGTAYMLARLSDRTREDEAVERIHEALRPLARRHTSPSTSGGSMRAAYLVDSERLDEFTTRIEVLERDLERVSIACTGPWPPYSFTGEPGR